MFILKLLRASSVWRSGMVCMLLSFIFLTGFPKLAQAHFTHFEPRIIHVSQQHDGVQFLIRMPLPLLLLSKNWKGGREEQEVQFTRREGTGELLRYRIDAAALENRFPEFEQLILANHSLKKNDQLLGQLSVTHTHIFNSDQRKSFSSLATAENSFRGGKIVVEAAAVDLFDSSIDIRLFAPDIQLSSSFSIDSDLGIHLTAIERLANIVQVHDGKGGSNRFSSIGPLHIQFALESDHIGEFIGHLKSGIVHILVGLDHVLFVLLIALASCHWLQTLKRATVFTVGHSISLSLGLFGYIPEGNWFVPMVETLIALTILYAGVAVVVKRQEVFGYSAILFVGLIHGFGFSFVLSDLASEAGGLNIADLIGFNLGIEVGQLAIYCAIALLLFAYQRVDRWQRLNFKVLLSLAAILVSTVWIFERGGLLLTELQYLGM